MAMAEESGKRKQVYTYEAPWSVYAMGWSTAECGRLAVGSFTEDYENKVHVLEMNGEAELEVKGSFEHPYPPTRLMWSPASHKGTELLASSGDYLRLWSYDADAAQPITEKCTLRNKHSEFCAPLTSFDWNKSKPALVGTSSIDTTCTIWDVEKGETVTQLIAHDKEVYDIAFSNRPDCFASVGADGSVRMFDLRSLEHSTIVYETADRKPLLRVCWNAQDDNYLSTICMDTNATIILDIRSPSRAAAVLAGHHASVNAVSWAPHSSVHLATAGDDKQVLIWDLSPMPKVIESPILCYDTTSSSATGGGEVNSLTWSSAQPDLIGICYGTTVQVLRV